MVVYSKDGKLLLMGSSGFNKKELPLIIQQQINYAIAHKVIFLVAEARGACRLFQDYLALKKYKKVIVGHALSIRYNAGNWITVHFGETLLERERNMIDECDYALVIWQDKSGTIGENLRYLKKKEKPTIVFEYDTSFDVEHIEEWNF